MNPNYRNKANTRANVKVFSTKPFNAYKNLVDVSDINESIVEETPVTTVTKVTPKPKKKVYKKFEELEIVKASKKASKKPTGITYDKDFVYGVVSNNTISGGNKVNREDEEEDTKAYEGNNKITERESEYNKSDEEKPERRRRDFKGDNEEIKNLKKSARNRRKDLEEDENEYEYSRKAKNNYENRGNFEESYDEYETENKRKQYPQQKKRINIEPLRRYDQYSEEEIKDKKRNSQKVIQRDIYSCQYCEEVYKVIIFQSLPVKVFECFYCHNMINSTSLNFYYQKYDKERNDQLNSINPSQFSCSINPIITPKDIQEVRLEEQPSNKSIRIQETENMNFLATKKNTPIVEKKRVENPIETFQTENIKPRKIKEEFKRKEEIKIEEDIYDKKQIKNEPKEEKKTRKIVEDIITKNEKSEEKRIVQEKPIKKITSKTVVKEEKTPQFDKKWVDWNDAKNSDKKQEFKKNKELIEINICENNDIKGTSLADAFKKKKKEMVKRLENPEKENVPVNNNENTTIEYTKNSKNITGNDIQQDETNCTRADFKGDNTTIGEILNDSELRPNNFSSKIFSEKKEKKKNKYEQKNVIVEENEPSKELLDRLIYGKKAELNQKEIKEVNKRMYSKLVESKEKEKDEEKNRKKQELLKNKEKLKQYSDNLKNAVVKKQKN